jgi:hypothetical protein
MGPRCRCGLAGCAASGTDLENSLPLLPLQNTVALASEELTGVSRRVAVNTEAYVLSYRFYYRHHHGFIIIMVFIIRL